MRAYVVLLAVLVNSFFGLLRPMMEAGADIFVDVWTASLFGDLLFTAGTIGVVYAGRWMMFHEAAGVRAMAWLAVPVLNLFVYALAWTATSGAMFNGETMWFAFRFVAEWGWIGLAVSALVAGGAAWAGPDRLRARSAGPA